MTVIVGTLVVELYISDALTLKDRRQVVKSLVGRIGERFNVSVAEVGGQDTHRHAALAIAAVSNSGEHVGKMLNSVLRFCESDPRAEVANASMEID